MSFIQLFKYTIRLFKQEPILIAPITIYLFCTEFFSFFLAQNEKMTTLTFMSVTLFISVFLKGILFLAAFHVMKHNSIDLDALRVEFRHRMWRLVVMAVVIVLPSIWFNQTVSLPLLYNTIEPEPMLFVKGVVFLFFSLYSIFLLLFTMYETVSLWELFARSFRFVVAYFFTILKHLILCMGMLFIILMGFGLFFMIPKIGPVVAVFVLGIITSVFFVYVSVLYHYTRRTLILD